MGFMILNMISKGTFIWQSSRLSSICIKLRSPFLSQGRQKSDTTKSNLENTPPSWNYHPIVFN
eukprot:1160334-Amphidinium_carterae.1